MSGPERIGGELERQLRRFPPAAGMTAIVAAWPGAVGEAIARNAWPARLARDGTLHAATRSSAWAFELTQLEVDVRSRLSAALRGEIALTRIRFTPGALPETPAAEAATDEAAPRAPDAASVAEAARITTVIGDEKLRKIVARAAAASLAGAGSDRSV